MRAVHGIPVSGLRLDGRLRGLPAVALLAGLWVTPVMTVTHFGVATGLTVCLGVCSLLAAREAEASRRGLFATVGRLPEAASHVGVRVPTVRLPTVRMPTIQIQHSNDEVGQAA